MLHELLLALNGHIGGLFTLSDSKIKVLPVAFLHPGEEALLNRICEHGTYYKRFQDFINNYINFKTNKDIAPGLYMNAFCYTLQDDILSDYEQALVELEEEIMMDTDIPLTYIQSKLQDYTLLFPTLILLLEEIQRRKMRGCQLLGLVEKYSTTGIPTVQATMTRFIFNLHKVMYKQLSSWLLHGILMDPYSEFFVHKVKKVKTLASVPNNQDDELGIGGVSGQQLQQIQNAGAEILPKDSVCFEQFSLRGDMLPSYMPTRILHKIVFIGESVDMFENNDKLDVKKSILKHKAMDYSKDLYNLSQADTFQMVDFENVIDVIRTCVTERLWEYVVNESNLKETLHRLKDIYLLGRGDLYQAMIESADSLLSCPPSPMTTHDANRVFNQVIRSLNINDEKLQSFRLSVESAATKQSATSGTQKTKQNGWNIMSINYKPDWPLHVFFTSLALERYNCIFKFLLAVKRVHVSLHQAWKHQMCRWASQPADDGQQALLYQIRNHMQFLVDNLQTYLQVDVIESQFYEMLDKIDESKDFEIIRSTHETFLANLLSQCFLLNVPVNHCLTCILEGCTSFCALLNSCEGTLAVDQLEHCKTLQAMFQKQTLLLFKILTSSKTHQRNPYLVQLLLRIDFNKYFSSAGQQLG